MGQNIQSVKHRKASRMHHDPNINETELLCNTSMLQKYNYFSQTCSQIPICLESLNLRTFDRKRLKNVEIKKPTKETKNEKNVLPHLPTPAPARPSIPPLPKGEGISQSGK